MRTTPRLLVILATATTLLLPGAVAHANPTGTVATRGIEWAPCDEDPTVECGTLSVPIDWSRRHGPTLDLALARRPATGPEARIGSLVINPGGPGGSGVDFALFADGYFSEEIQRRFDIVGFDPRGVARSNPVVCSLDLLSQSPSPLPANQAEFDALVAFNRTLGDDCRDRTGPVFDRVDTLSVVHDLDAIRAALGERRLTYYGVSYGTLIGQQYAERYPHRVRALALDSNMDHSLGTRRFMDTETESMQDSFDAFVDWCDRTPDCALHGADVRAVWAELLARAARGELTDPGDPETTLTSFDLIGLAFSAFYGPAWFPLADFLAALAADEPLSADAVAAWQDLDEEEEYAFPAVFCQDWDLPVRDFREFDRHLRRLARLAPDVRYSPLGVIAPTTCLGWPGEVTNPQHRLRVPPGPRLLLANSLYDPATGYNWAVNAARQLGRSAVLLTYEGAGHGVYGRSDCVTNVFDDYLISVTLPERGARCPGVDPEPVIGLRQPGLPAPPGPRPGVPGWSNRL